MKKSSFGTKIFCTVAALGILVYFGLQAVQYFGDPLTTTLAYRYQVEEEVSLSGYVVRDEVVLEDNTNGLLQLQRAEGERISAGGVVATVYTDQASLDRQQEIQSLQTQLEQLQYAQEATLGAEVSLRLDAQILQNILDYKGALAANRLDTAEGYGSELRTLILKRDYTYSGTEDLSAQVAELESQLQTLRSQAGSSSRRITAPEAGLYSAVVDGYETVLTPESLESLTPGGFSDLQADETVHSSVGKLILGDSWYYAALMDEDQVSALEGKSQVSLRFAKGMEDAVEVTVSRISQPENGQVVVIFEGTKYLPELTLLRQQSADVILNTVEGIRVPKEALRVRETTTEDEDGTVATVTETGVYCVLGAEACFKPVEVLYNGDDFLLVRSTLDTAEGDLTTAQEARRLRTGEEVIVTANNLYDGKVLQ